MRKRFFSLLSFVFMAFGLSAQSLVFHECGGGETVVTLPADMHIEASSGVVTFSSGSKSVAIPLGAVKVISFRGKKGDVNDDQTVDVADISTIISIMAGNGGDTETEADEKGDTFCPNDKHPHMIDLGLPSGTKWACCNVGASKPEEYGNYYAWGETKTKEVYNWDTYQYGYYNDDYDFSDDDYSHLVNIGSDIAGTSYDAATANWGALWRMPSKDQIEELRDNTTCTWTKHNGVNGRKFTGSNGGTIFLPAAGVRYGSDLYSADPIGLYWSSTFYESRPYGAYTLFFSENGVHWSDDGVRDSGQSVRPVR